MGFRRRCVGLRVRVRQVLRGDGVLPGVAVVGQSPQRFGLRDQLNGETKLKTVMPAPTKRPGMRKRTPNTGMIRWMTTLNSLRLNRQ